MSIETACMYNIVFMRGKKSCKGWISMKCGVTVWWPNLPANILKTYLSLIKIKIMAISKINEISKNI